MTMRGFAFGHWLHERRRYSNSPRYEGCRLPQPRGWECIREPHLTNEACALVPKWWNVKGWWVSWRTL